MGRVPDDGRHVLIRPLREEDRERERQFINRLSPATRHFRFLGEIRKPARRSDQLMDIDYQQSMAFVALVHEDGELREVGISRYAACCEGRAVRMRGNHRRRLPGSGPRRRADAPSDRRGAAQGFRQMYSVTRRHRAMRDLCCALGLKSARRPGRLDPGHPPPGPVARSGAPAAQAEPEQAAGQETGGEQQWVEHVVVE